MAQRVEGHVLRAPAESLGLQERGVPRAAGHEVLHKEIQKLIVHEPLVGRDDARGVGHVLRQGAGEEVRDGEALDLDRAVVGEGRGVGIRDDGVLGLVALDAGDVVIINVRDVRHEGQHGAHARVVDRVLLGGGVGVVGRAVVHAEAAVAEGRRGDARHEVHGI